LEKLLKPEKSVRWKLEANNYHYIYRSRPEKEIDGEFVICDDVFESRSDVPIATPKPLQPQSVAPVAASRTQVSSRGKKETRLPRPRQPKGVHVNVVRAPPTTATPPEHDEVTNAEILPQQQVTPDGHLIFSPLFEIQIHQNRGNLPPINEFASAEKFLGIVVLLLFASIGLLLAIFACLVVRQCVKVRGCACCLPLANILATALHSVCELVTEVAGGAGGGRANAARANQRRVILGLLYLLYVLVVLYFILD
jgi:hypothetical protein